MLRNIALLVAVTLWSSGSLLLPTAASAQTPLTRAVVESLRNQVRLIPKNQSARAARPSDAMNPGDALATAKASMAQVRFNDGSLARLGEQAVFKFNPGTRTLDLSNGTALVLIPPGRGTTRVRTPNAAAGIRGSALFVRYIPETDTTVVGALTTSGIEVFNDASSQRQELKAGNMAVIVKDRIEKVYEFDLKTFYQTSELTSGLNLTKSESMPTTDAAIAQVQAETSQALQAQSPIAGVQVIENPNFIQLSANPSNPGQDFPPVDRPVTGNTNRSRQQNRDVPRNTIRNTIDVRTILQGGEIRDAQFPTQFPNPSIPGDNNPGGGNDDRGNNGGGNDDRGNNGRGNDDRDNNGRDNNGRRNNNSGRRRDGNPNRGNDPSPTSSNSLNPGGNPATTPPTLNANNGNNTAPVTSPGITNNVPAVNLPTVGGSITGAPNTPTITPATTQ